MRERRKHGPGRYEKPGHKGVRLQMINSVMIVIIVIVSVVLLVGLDILTDTYRSLRATTDAYIACQDDARNMIEASDFLTNQARAFVVTGNKAYLDNYFSESTKIQRRDQALEDMKDYLPTTEAVDYLEGAMQESVRLMDTEYYAMRMVVDAKGYDLDDFPKEIRDVQLSAKDAALSPAGKIEAATEMVFGRAYQKEKEEIAEYVRQCLQQVLHTVQRGEDNNFEKMETTMRQVSMLIGVMMFLFLAMIIVILRLIIKPLEDNIDAINSKAHLPMRGAFELQYMASVYNRMYDENKEKSDQLAYEATHDALTGAYNRAGFEERYSEEDTSSITLILLDVDLFKQINDKYGHSVGDLILRQVAHLIRDSFRQEDYVCRIGGDEFAIILIDADSSIRGAIEEKFHSVNGKLQHPVGTLPPVSLSAGVAFPDRKDPSDNMFRDADEALYEVKRHGRSGIWFYGDKRPEEAGTQQVAGD